MTDNGADTTAALKDSPFSVALIGALVLDLLLVVVALFAVTAPHPKTIKPTRMKIHMIEPPALIHAPSRPAALPRPPAPVVPPRPRKQVETKPLPRPKHPQVEHALRPPPVHRPPQTVMHRSSVPPQPVAPQPTLARPLLERAPAATAPPPSPAEIQSAEARYAGMLRSEILSRLVVPRQLRNLGATGIATVIFRVSPNGQLVWARVKRSSAYAEVNRVAMASVERAHFPQFLRQMPHQPITFEIPIRVSGSQ